jgi:holin-like protein
MEARMLAHLTLLLCCQLLGEVLVLLLGLPVPGAVLGMALLFTGLLVSGEASAGLRETSEGLLRHLSLLFVPAGVGVMVHLKLIAEEWLAIGVSLVVSTLLAVIVTALAMRWLAPAPEAGQVRETPR